ncbi:neuraminidase-like domain-containing protein [Nitrosomonas aestuarii]|uniref:Tc toxin subunit A-related protein n=1 Tax=Nitrosomonas aestuarii TaxID=52441 RepID=UPI000D322381|nr:neuraminidase-like domain-containing protein [Nitrosomonas aestuarii]PTN11846.1 virulence plasmid A protein [Nitrosomonas aestuarii]
MVTFNQKINFFKFDLKAEKQQKAFEAVFNENNGNWAAIKSQLSGKEGFTDAVIQNLEFTHQLADWSHNNARLVSVFQKDSQINSMRDLALNLNKTALVEKIKVAAPGESEEGRRTFALNLHRELFHLEPTAMLVNMIKDPEIPILNDAVGANVASVLVKQPDFNIRTTSIYELFKNEAVWKGIPVESQEAVKMQFKNLQRIAAVSPLADAVPVLFNANLQSAMRIAALPKAQFIAALDESDLDENTLLQIHDNAQQAQVRNEHFLMSIREAAQPTGVAMIDKSLGLTEHAAAKNLRPVGAAVVETQSVADQLNENILKHNLSWDLLFGDADFCECGECNSVYSAAAYYVELLNFLRNNNLDPDAGGSIAIKFNPKDISDTPLEKLFDRRPDLGCLELTCQNTNTLIPYVDLVNEVMENYVAFKYLKPFNVNDETSGELLAAPQHTEYQAYCILKKEVYPFTLPYHQPIDAARIYLKFLDTSRHELIDTFRKNNDGEDAGLTDLKDEALNRAADAEFLAITMEEYVILTKECFETKALMDRLKNRNHTDGEYKSLIGVKPVNEYYGYDDEATMLGEEGLTLIKKTFLRRTGIDYFNLVDLLKTQTINPCLPKGRSKVIMESLRFSYRFLQNYARIHGIDKMAEDLVKMEKFADWVPLIKEQIELLTNKKVLSCPESRSCETGICDKDIICWVKYQFEKIGKMIVIESGKGCVDGRILSGNNPPSMLNVTSSIAALYKVEDCKISYEFRDRVVELGSIDKKTGKITLLNNNPEEINPDNFKNLSFIGEKGERGIFLVIENEVYLTFTEQKDNCNLDTALLQHLDGTALTVEEYDRIHRFIRLWRKLGWTIDEIDKAVVGLSVARNQESGGLSHSDESICDDGSDECGDVDGDCGDYEEEACAQVFDITPELIHQLAAVRKLLDKTGLELIKLLSFWAAISTSGEKSLYQRLFLTHNVLGIDKIFRADSSGNYLSGDAKLSEHVPVVMAALNYSADDIQLVKEATAMEDKLTLDNLSLLYRYRLLAKILGLRIPAFVGVSPLFGNIFANAHATLAFMKRWGKMEDAGFSHQQLNYIIRNVDDKRKPFAPTQKEILQLSKTLYDGLNAIDEAHKDLTADPAITDAALKKINIQEQGTSTLVRAKASLLFDAGIVEKILAYLEGSNVFITNAPKNLDFTLPDTQTLKAKLKYDKTQGTIQITGILTDSEAANYQTISNDPLWVKALERIQKQQDKLFKELLIGIFKDEKTKTSAEKASLIAIIKSGDITVALDQIPEGEADSNTAPQKRVAFLDIFLPYLRQQLTYRFVIDTLANFAGVDSKITDVLVSEILKQGTPVAPVYDTFEKIKDSSKPAEANWSGYLIPAADGSYTFIARDSDNKPVISIDGVSLDFTVQEDPTNEWWSAMLSLQAGKLYKLSTTGIELRHIFWKTPASAITVLPSSALIPDFASKQCEPALIALKKAAMLVSGFDLSADELRFFDKNKIEFENLDFNALTLEHWLRLEAYVRLRNSLPQAILNMLDFWNWVYDDASDPAGLSEKIAALTAWKKDRIEKLIAEDHFNLVKLADYRNEENLLKLQKALNVADKIGMDIDSLFDWAIPTSRFKKCRAIADGIKNSIRAKYNQTDWEQVVKPLNDELRNHQRDALTAYLLQQPELIAWNVTDADGLFEYFLIDVQMDACMETSRIKQAISSVQLFVQRCFLGLEEEHNGIQSDVLDRPRWNWVQHYRVWEANRKVFLYPENWIESNLRDDKSAFFKELEGELLQKDINKQNVTDALKSYLYKVDDVANMEVVGLYIDGQRTTTPEGRVKWSNSAKLHVFSRTRNAPFFFYYRYLALDEMNWYSWEKIQVDIPSYDEENAFTQEIKGNGCYLVPVVWNGRLLIFFPQIMKKTKPSNDGSKKIKDVAEDSVNTSKPVEYYEIKMGWSEYRNGKWTQKQISRSAVLSDPRDAANDIQYFKFVPIIYEEKVLIEVDDNLDSDGGFKGAFEFNGNTLRTGTAVVTSPIPINYFNQNDGKMYSWQIDSANLTRQNTDIYFYEDNAKEKIQGLDFSQSEFYHSKTQSLLGRINLGQLTLFFSDNLSMPANDFGPFDQDASAATPDIYHELKRPYSLYNWELFFHTPILLADALSKAQQFEEAMQWLHFVFNPIAAGNADNRFWQFKPFKEINSQQVLDSIFNNLKPNEKNDAINEWRNKPFMPHVVARSRPVAYMKWVVMKYIDNLLAWGDYLFRQDTIETLNRATQIYVLAGHILGPKPMMIPKRGKIKPQTYLGLLDKWDAFGNAVVELELAAPFSNQTALPFGTINNEMVFANIYGIASSLYFCIPNNPKLMGYWDTLADRLYKIRHCLNIQGVFRKLPLFEPPIDPALLVKAAAQGLSIASVLNDLNTPMPNYRFYYLLQKALELCNELKSLGGAMLSAIEKKDNETIALIRTRHENVMQNLVMEIKKKQLEEAQKNIDSLQQNRKGPEARMKYYLKLSGLDESLMPNETVEFNGIPNDIVTVDGDSGLKLIPFEKEDMDKAGQAQDKQLAAALPEKIASILHIIPNFSGNIQPFGIGMSISVGGSNFGAASQAWAKFLQLDASELTYASTSAGKKGGFTRTLQERIFQANAAGYELKQIDKQITVQEIRINIANQEITNQQKAIDNASEVEEFLKNKYTSEELYTWMHGTLKTLCRQIYNLAYDLAKKVEKTYCFERGISSANFIQAGYFDAGREGLLAGEQLYVGLKQLEAAYQNERGYDYEITRHISLNQLDPLALIALRETGKCEFVIPEVLFDLDYPGHYKRRVKSVSLSIPCVAGPYTGINATLSLLEHKFRNTAIGGKGYQENTEETDERFSTYIIPISAVAVSSAQNDSGMFELNFRDERYLPFEGAGAVSKWRLELPAIRQYDYHTIADAILQLKYTASEGGERLKLAATQSLSKQLENIEQALNETGLHSMLNMRHDLSNEWQSLKKNGSVKLTIAKSRLPYFTQVFANTAIEDVMFIAKIKNNPNSYSINIDGEITDLSKISNELKLCRGNNSDIKLDNEFELSVDSGSLANLEELMLIIKFKI